MSRMYLSGTASSARVRAAERARRNRAEIVRELSWGRVSRRDLIKMGLFTSAGILARFQIGDAVAVPASRVNVNGDLSRDSSRLDCESCEKVTPSEGLPLR